MSTSFPPATATDRRPWWPWVMLGLGLVWTILIRILLILNAEDHLDSDLAVNGLTLLDAVHGHWRWHYPGTPYMGILPMLSSYPQALVWGANPISLVSGGTVIWVLVVVSTFWLAWQAFGPSVAGWAIVPLVFSFDGHDLAVGPDHRGTSSDAGLAHVGFRGAIFLPGPRRLEARRKPGRLVRARALPRRHVPVHARRPGPGGDARLALRREAAAGNCAGLGVPGRDDRRSSAPRDRPVG